MVTLVQLYELICKSCRETRQATEPEHLDGFDNVCCKPNPGCSTNSHQHTGLMNELYHSLQQGPCQLLLRRRQKRLYIYLQQHGMIVMLLHLTLFAVCAHCGVAQVPSHLPRLHGQSRVYLTLHLALKLC